MPNVVELSDSQIQVYIRERARRRREEVLTCYMAIYHFVVLESMFIQGEQGAMAGI